MATLLNPFIRGLDANADAVSGALLYIFEAGTTTPVTTYSDSSLTTAQAHPLVANAAGEFEQSFLESGTYKIRVADSGAVVLYENDDVRMADRPEGPIPFDDIEAVLAVSEVYPTGTYLEAVEDNIAYEVAATGATDQDYTSPSGVKLYVHSKQSGANVRAFGAVGDGSTDDTTAFVAAVGSFDGARGKLFIPDGNYSIATSRIDFKRVAFVGNASTPNSGGGGVELLIGSAGGLYTTVEDNAGPRHENIRITSTSEKLENGQVCLDLTGINYPRLNNITTYGGESGIKISGGSTIESHYSTLTNVNVSRAYYGYHIEGGSVSQTHNFFGGRAWDCVHGYRNGGTGASDINFFGTAFESDSAILHDATASAAQTKWFGCRNESTATGTVEVGQFTQFGTYWSGDRRADGAEAVSGEIVEHDAQLRTIGVNNSVEMIGANVLPNPLFDFDPSQAITSSTLIPGWSSFGATNYSGGKAMEGNYWRLERQAASGTVGLFSRKFKLLKGRYAVSLGYIKENYGTSGTVSLNFYQGGASFGAAGTYADVTFPLTYPSSELVTYVEILQDIDDFQFLFQISASTTGRLFHVFNPQMVAGLRSYISAPSRPSAVREMYGTAAPTSGTFVAGDKVTNVNTGLGAPVGWTCVTDGSPGTWVASDIIRSVSATGGNGNYTITAGTSDTTQRVTQALTDDRTITLDTASAWEGAKFRVSRTAASTGAFVMSVGGLVDLATSEWCDVEYDGSAWLMTAKGALT